MTTLILSALLSAWAAPPDSTIALDGVVITGKSSRDHQLRSSQSSVQVDKHYLDEHFAGSLMQTLEAIPGVKARAIGSGQSKPTIRGLGANRMAVAQDGVKHEGQQWGDDHGLEIDQFAVDRAEVIKGPAALLYGSDAIGGVLSLYSNHVPTEPFAGTLQLFGRTNNEQLGLAARLEGRRRQWFCRANVTLIDYADYRVPTDSISYYSYRIALDRQRLRNTAGTERDALLMLGYVGYRFHTDLLISDTYSKSGFFANAHGLEVRLSTIDYDRSRRDISLPSQSVNHLKLISHSSWQQDTWHADLNLAYQNNLRQEHSEPLSHGYMPTPPGTLERRFRKHTLTAQLALRLQPAEHHDLRAGLSGEYQHNRRGGWGFIIPDFETATAGAYATDQIALGSRVRLNAGLRYDIARTAIHSYRDWYATPVIEQQGEWIVDTGDSICKQRSAAIARRFSSLTWSAGITVDAKPFVLKANVGKSFRVPIPKELGADGVNYHIFRYEQGNAALDPEESYQADATLSYDSDVLSLHVDPFVNIFPNYIYLNPTPRYTDEGLQLYQYTQARVLRYGFEAQALWHVTSRLTAELGAEYLHAEQRSGPKKGYTVPFSTPWSADGALRYAFHLVGHDYVGLSAHLVGSQHDIVPPEKPTSGYWRLDATAGTQFAWGQYNVRLTLHADNLLDRRYYDHTSFYRLIDVPEPGRNVSLMAAIDF